MKSLFSILIALVLFLPISVVRAVPTGLPFGGLVTSVVPCTCPPFGLWIQYAPFFPGLPGVSKVPIIGALYYPPVAPLFAFFQIGIPGTFNKGIYLPGPGFCLVGEPPACVPLPAMGVIEYVGTSSLAPLNLLIIAGLASLVF